MCSNWDCLGSTMLRSSTLMIRFSSSAATPLGGGIYPRTEGTILLLQ
ncbi:hypothetical protein LINPERPRIM_LOCUS14487 [Linum perenne]